MGKYLLQRILFSLFSVIAIVFTMILLLFTFTDRSLILQKDEVFSKLQGNTKEYYADSQYALYDYIDIKEFSDYIIDFHGAELDERELEDALFIPEEIVDDEKNPYILEFTNYYEAKGYTVKRLESEFTRGGALKDGYEPYLYAVRNSNPFLRVWNFFKNIITIETVNDIDKTVDELELAPTKGYYLVSDINEWESFNNYWSANKFKLVSSDAVTPKTEKGIAYSVDMGVKEENIVNGEFKYAIAHIDGDGKVSIVEGSNASITAPGEYRFKLYNDYDENKNSHYSFELEQLSTFGYTFIDRGGIFPVEEKSIKLIWDEYSNMPAIVGSGTTHKYLLYFDNQFPYIHQNFIHFSLGTSLAGTTKGRDVTDIMFSNEGQGAIIVSDQQFPTQLGTDEYKKTSYNFHTARYNYSDELNAEEYALFGDRYMSCSSYYSKMPKVGYSFTMGIIATLISYFLGIPLGILMARKKDKLADQIGIGYIIFTIAVPSLAYIYIFRAFGSLFGLPDKFTGDILPKHYILPIISLVLPSIAGTMRWIRRYMIDQANSDYVKFAKSQGLSEGEIFTKHIAKNAMIPIVHGIPGSIIGCLAGAFITEAVYAVPGTGGLLNTAINEHNNGTILGLTFFYSVLSIISLILGDIMLTIVDPRISFTGGRK